ncbi:MAG: nitroreductase family protein [Bacteroidales bacterium]|jgi:nitroreductase|nr:nitroreductase family protein [Bacteroidales bacterium]MDD4002303.1 nitroreductase family protein [Bacteroidales bacterium]MDD4528311.1 nitroreductase family protein [Bacteroidales bacterium]MDD4829404.1 nitroreductase family protein [Bacteroidales bacterium]
MKLIKLLLISLLLISSTTIAQNTNKSDEVMKNILERKSVRTYANKKVEKEDIETLLRAAMAAPSAVNAQPWVFIAIDDRQILDNLASQLPNAKMLSQAQAAIIVCGNMEKALQGEGREYWVQDCSAATQNILLAAESMGLGAVWTGVYPKKERVNIIQTEMLLPSHIVPLCVIPIGWQTGKEKPKQKYTEENIRWNKWEDK